MFYICLQFYGPSRQKKKSCILSSLFSLVFAFCLWLKAQNWSSACSVSLLSDCHYFGLLFKPDRKGRWLTSLSSSLRLIGLSGEESELQSSFLKLTILVLAGDEVHPGSTTVVPHLAIYVIPCVRLSK